jgi:cytochrome d ubiquinol oxidase subunit II
VTLEEFWFVLIGVLWSGYFVLEGFDFGVGMLLPFLPRDERERGLMFQAIGPVWDGNEVWLVVAAGATFAAFPAWYATVFSGFYVALLVILVLLIVRVVSFDWRERHPGGRWRVTWLWANSIGSFGAAFLWALALANFVQGVPLDSSHVFTGGIADLFSPYTVVMGLAVVALFALHGATYLELRTSGELRGRAAATAGRLGPLAALLTAGGVTWTVVVAHQNNQRAVLPVAVPAVLTGVLVIAAAVLAVRRRPGWTFAATGLAAVGVVATIFTGLYPRVLVSDPTFGNSLTISNAASGHYALQVITVVAVVFTPIILLYQGWTYHVLRARLGGAADAGTAERPREPQAG